MYDYSKECIYMYSPRGYNWRGFAAWFISFAVIFPVSVQWIRCGLLFLRLRGHQGLISAYIPDKMTEAPKRIYSMVNSWYWVSGSLWFTADMLLSSRDGSSASLCPCYATLLLTKCSPSRWFPRSMLGHQRPRGGSEWARFTVSRVFYQSTPPLTSYMILC